MSLPLWDILESRIKEYGEKAVFLYFKDQKITYKKFGENIDRIANGLLDFGIKPRDKVCIVMPNCSEWLYSYFALQRIKAVAVPINIHLKGESLKYILDASEAKAIFTDAQLLENYKPIRKELKYIKKEIIRPKDGETPDIELSENTILYSDLYRYPPTPPEIPEEELAGLGIVFTSGTTGPPKGVVTVRSAPQAIQGVMEIWDAMGTKPGETIYACLPLFHGNALGVSTLGSLVLGCSLALGERFSASRLFDECRKYNAVEFNTLGAMIPFLLKQPERPDDADNPVRVVLDAGCPREMWRPFEKRFNVKIVEWFGMVDAPGYLLNTDGPLGAMGKPVAGTEFKVFDDNDNELPPHKVGELVFRIPGVEAPTAYYKEKETTERAWRGGWFHTGDLAYRDEEGWFYFAGRKKESMRRRGENISAWEVESVVNRHPKVSESAAIGVPFELGEEDVKIVVVVKEDEKLTPEELLDYCQENMPYFQVPTYVEFVESIPRTPTQRPRYKELKKEPITPKTWDRVKVGYKLKREIERELKKKKTSK